MGSIFIVVHITDTRLDYDLEMCNTGHRARGWDSCGYNWLILRDGEIVESRGFKQGAHTKGYNRNSYGIGLVGKDSITDLQAQAFNTLHSRLNFLPVFPHNEFNKHKACPTETVWQTISKNLAGVL